MPDDRPSIRSTGTLPPFSSSGWRLLAAHLAATGHRTRIPLALRLRRWLAGTAPGHWRSS